MLKSKYLSILFCVSSGLNEDNLGSDEAELINICSIVIDLNKNTTVDICEYFIKPSNEKAFSASFLSDECKNLTLYNESYFKNSITLEQFITEFDNRLTHLNLHPNENEFMFITDGPLHLRQALIPECSKKDIDLPDYYFKYFDLRNEYRKFADNDNLLTLAEISNCLNIKSKDELDYSLKNCRIFEDVIYKMIQNEYFFRNPELISRELEQGLCSIDDQIEENTIIRVRGLPWQCTDFDVNKFFAGLNIANGGVALCLSPQGRRNGEALVRFVNEEQRNLALKRHKHHIGPRYIEVYRASGKDFLSIAGGSNSEAKAFLSRNGKVIIRMRGLPFDSVAKDVVEFFERNENCCKIVDDVAGVLFVHYPDGRATGDAFVMFKTEEEANKALLKHKEMMGVRYIELFRSTSAEVQQVFKRSQDPKFYQNALKDLPLTPLPILPPEMISGGNRKDCIRLKNLPLDCGVEQILEFLGIHSQHIVQQGVHMILNSQGQPSGEAFIQFDGEQSALNVSNHKNNKCMFFSGRKYFIEVTQCSGEEMNLVLMGLLPSNLINGRSTTPKTITQTNTNSNQFNPMNQLPQPPVNLQLQPNLFYPNVNSSSPQIRALANPPNQMPLQNPPIMPNQYPNAPPFAPIQPIIWYYPTPPVSPSSTLFLHPPPIIHSFTTPFILIVKNAPFNITVADILQFFNGYEIMPDCIQIQNNSENGVNTADVYITLFNRNEAERAVIEKNRQKIGNHSIELYLSI